MDRHHITFMNIESASILYNNESARYMYTPLHVGVLDPINYEQSHALRTLD